MTEALFPHYANIVKAAIKAADNASEQMAANILIDHLENDFLFLRFTGKEEAIQDLRNYLQEKHEELNRENQIHTKCGTFSA